MKLAIFGTKDEAVYLMRQIELNNICDILVFVDNDKNKQGKYIGKYPIVSFEKLESLYGKDVDTIIIAARGSYSRLSILHQLKSKNINFQVQYEEDFYMYQHYDDADRHAGVSAGANNAIRSY